MKIRNEYKELSQMGKDNLMNRLRQERQELAQMRINKVTMHVKDYSQYNKRRKTIARILTLLCNVQ
jgi:ribosomal protein L29